MAETPKLDAHHRATVERILSHPTSHNIEWHDVVSLLEQVGSVAEEHDGVFKVTVGSETETFRAPRLWRYRRAAGSRPAADAQERRDPCGRGVTPVCFSATRLGH